MNVYYRSKMLRHSERMLPHVMFQQMMERIINDKFKDQDLEMDANYRKLVGLRLLDDNIKFDLD